MEGVLSTVEVTLKMFRRITNPAERGCRARVKFINECRRITNPAERENLSIK